MFITRFENKRNYVRVGIEVVITRFENKINYVQVGIGVVSFGYNSGDGLNKLHVLACMLFKHQECWLLKPTQSPTIVLQLNLKALVEACEDASTVEASEDEVR